MREERPPNKPGGSETRHFSPFHSIRSRPLQRAHVLWREALDAHRPVTIGVCGRRGAGDAQRSSEASSHMRLCAGSLASISVGGGGGGCSSGDSSASARSEARELQWWRVRLSKNGGGGGGGGALTGGEAELVEQRLRSSLAALRERQRDDSEREYRRERDLITQQRDANLALRESRLERAEMRRRQTARLSGALLNSR